MNNSRISKTVEVFPRLRCRYDNVITFRVDCHAILKRLLPGA